MLGEEGGRKRITGKLGKLGKAGVGTGRDGDGYGGEEEISIGTGRGGNGGSRYRGREQRTGEAEVVTGRRAANRQTATR